MLDETMFCRPSSSFLHRLLLELSEVSNDITASIFMGGESYLGESVLQYPPEWH